MAKVSKPIVAMVYDFDGTLAPGNMQEHSFLPDNSMGGKKAKSFWKEVRESADETGTDPILQYMYEMVHVAKKNNVKTTKESFRNRGKELTLFNGTDTWFPRVNKIAKDLGIVIEHYVISCGNQEIIEGTSIAKNFTKIYGCKFKYDNNGAPEWPAQVINYTNKTQYLFRINKGCLDLSDDSLINSYVPEIDRKIPFSRIIYLGDGDTDIPCMKLVKEAGGYSIAVFDPKKSKSRNKCENLRRDGRASFVCTADYSEGKKLENLVTDILGKIAIEVKLRSIS